MKTSTIVALVVAAVIVAGGAWWLFAQPAAAPTTNTNTTASTTDTTGSSGVDVGADVGIGELAQSVTVHYDGTSFSPKSVTVAKGGTVTWVNDSTGRMWVASASHPTHTLYDGTSESSHCAASYTGPAPFDQCTAGGSYTFTFSKAGTFNYHNHANSSATGSVTVQ